MLFGLPWYALIPLAAIIGGLFYAYKEQEMKLEEKRLAKSREINELRKIISGLKARVESLEAKVAQQQQSTAGQANEEANPLHDIEVEEEEQRNPDKGSDSSPQSIKNNLRDRS